MYNRDGLAAKLRKHRTALIALATFNLVLFFPILFMGRVISPNDVFYNFDPWSLYRPFPTQNSQLHDPPTTYLPLMSLLDDHREAFHWNPYVACGIPGFGSSASALLTPLIALPVLLLPLAWVYTGIIFLKFNLAFLFAYLWLREERLGRDGAAIGSLIAAGAGMLSVRWLWQLTNATVFYAALLWIACRALRGRRTPMSVLILIALMYSLSGFPAAMAYGAILTTIYLFYRLLRDRALKVAGRRIVEASIAAALAVIIALPTIVPFVQFVRRSGYLEDRQKASLRTFYPAAHLWSFVKPDRLGNPVYKTGWKSVLPPGFNNYVEATVYAGLVALLLIPFAFFNRRVRHRWFWIIALALIAGAMFNLFGVPRLVTLLPGFRYTALTRLTLLLPIPLAFVAAAGAGALLRMVRRRRRTLVALTAGVLAVATAADLALFAGRFHPYLPPDAAGVPETPTISFLRAQPGPFRVAGFFNYFWPNSAELFRIEDIRSHFSSEGKYRTMLHRIDPTSWDGSHTVLNFNSLHFQFTDPLVGMLGIRYFLEHKSIDIIRWRIAERTTKVFPETGNWVAVPGQSIERTIPVDAQRFYAIEVVAAVSKILGPSPGLAVSLLKDGAPVWSREFSPADLTVMNRVYVPLWPYARQGEEVRLQLRPKDMSVLFLEGKATAPDSPLYYARVTTPVIFDRELPDGRLFRNVAEAPRFWAVSKVRKMGMDEFLALRDIDFGEEAIVTDSRIAPQVSGAGASVKLTSYAPAEQRLQTESQSPFFLASSEKLTPELRVTIDGREVRPLEIHLLFAGVQIPAGRHEVVFSRRIGRGWWGLAAAALAVWSFLILYDVWRLIPRARPRE